MSVRASPRTRRDTGALSRDELELWRQVTRSVARLAPCAGRSDRSIGRPAASSSEPKQLPRRARAPGLARLLAACKP